MAQIKVEDLCRTCLTKEIELTSVYEIYHGTVTIDCIISTLTGVKIVSGDGLPSTVCRVCKEKATNAYDFRLQSIQSDATLRKIHKKGKHEILEIDNKCVKTEQYGIDRGDDYLDIEFSLDFANGADSYDEVKNEVDTNAKDDLLNVVQDKKPDIKKKCVPAVDPREASGTYCPLCATNYDNEDGLTSHMWDHHADIMGPKKRGRPKRLGTTAILNKLSENGVHVKWVTDMKFECNFCSKQFRSKDDLAAHIVDTHKELKLVSCLLCKKMYLKREDFDKHTCQYNKGDDKEGEADETADVNKNALSDEVMLQVVISQIPETDCVSDICMCPWCGCVCAGPEQLARHRDDTHPEWSPRCHLCYKVFASLKSAARHRASCKQRERTFSCETCGARFAHEVSLNKHILRSHRGQTVSVRFGAERPRTYRCDTCAARFCRKDLLARHVKIHKPSDKVFECDTCKKKFHRRSNLRTHMRAHEGAGAGGGAGGAGGAGSACLCLYCGRGFSNSSNLIVHMRRHTGEKPYKCDFCGKGFPRSSDLQCHRRSHTGEKPCICGVCGKGFSRSNKLSRHMRVHTGVKPYKCVYCDKAFSQSNDLTLHVRRHTGDKPYVCELCGERFIQGTALHNHRRAHGHYSDNAAPPPLPYNSVHNIVPQN